MLRWEGTGSRMAKPRFVYAVEYTSWQECYVDSVWSTKKKAEARKKELGGYMGRYSVNEYTLDGGSR